MGIFYYFVIAICLIIGLFFLFTSTSEDVKESVREDMRNAGYDVNTVEYKNIEDNVFLKLKVFAWINLIAASILIIIKIIYK